jgi:hypothetical protein
MWAINQAKWQAAQKWCHEKSKNGRNVSFLIITEKNIDSLNGK